MIEQSSSHNASRRRSSAAHPWAVLALWALIALSARPAAAQDVTAVWDVAAGVWSVPANWDVNQVPDNDAVTSFIVVIDNKPGVVATCTLDQDATIKSITIDVGDTLIHQAGNRLSIAGGGATHSGVWTIDGTGAAADLLFLVNDQLSGPGEIELAGLNANILTNGTLMLPTTDMRIYGSGQILDGVGGVINNALIEADRTDPMVIFPGFRGFSNTIAGRVHALGAGGINVFQSQNFFNAGELNVYTNSNVYADSDLKTSGALSIFTGGRVDADNIIQTAGTTFVDAGAILSVVNTMTVQAGVLYGEGTVIGTSLAALGHIQPGPLGGPGTLTVNGTYTQQTGGNLDIDITNPTLDIIIHDLLNITGTANLAGTLNVAFTFPPPCCSEYRIINYMDRVGKFETVTVTGLNPDKYIIADYNTDNVTLIVVCPVVIDLSSRDESYRISDNRDNLGRIGPVAIGDINDDSYGDFVMGGARASLGGTDDTGIVYVRFGLNFGVDAGQFPEQFYDLTITDPLITNPTLSQVILPDRAGRPYGGVQINAELTGRFFGDSVAVGDFDGDDVQDIAIGNTDRLGAFDPTGPGRVYLIRGHANIGGLTSPQIERLINNSILIEGRNQGDLFGQALAMADVNNDGLDDLVIGAPNAGTGTVDVVYGRAFTELTQVSIDAVPFPHTYIIGPHDDSQFGFSLTLGELDGVAGEDLVVGVPSFDEFGADAGAAYLFHGGDSSYGPSLVNAIRLNLSALPVQAGLYYTSSRSDTLGYSLAVGDYDGDGTNDIAMGAPFANRDFFGIPLRSGAVVVKYLGGILNPVDQIVDMNFESDLIFAGGEANGKFGQSIVSGDFNDDGLSDLTIAAPSQASGSRVFSGTTYMMMGRPTDERLTGGIVIGDSGDGYSSADVTFLGDRSGDFSGWYMAVGDINNDGLDDIMLSGDRPGGVNNNNGTTWTTFGSECWIRLPSSIYPVSFQLSVNATTADSNLWNIYE